MSSKSFLMINKRDAYKNYEDFDVTYKISFLDSFKVIKQVIDNINQINYKKEQQ